MHLTTGLVAIALTATLLATEVRAEGHVWYLYRGDAGVATLVVIDKAEIEESEPFWPFAMQCSAGNPWMMTVAEVDEKRLAEAIAAGGPAEFSFVVDGEAGGRGLGGYFPELRFGQMFGEWEYSTAFDPDTLKELVAADTLAITGTGVDMALPVEGMKTALTDLMQACARFEQNRP